MKQIFDNAKQVFTTPAYISISIFAALTFYFFNVFIVDIQSFFHGFSYGFLSGLQFIGNLLIGFKNTVETHTFITIIVLSILFGMLVSLILFKTRFAQKANHKHEGKLATLGIFLGLLAPGCAACGVGLISILGLSSSFVTFFPFHGLELSIAAIIIISITILHLLKNLTTCKLKKH